MDPRKRKEPDTSLSLGLGLNLNDNWREGTFVLRIRNKAVIARVLYKRIDANTDELNRTTKEKVRRALLDAKCSEERFYTEATNEQDYRTKVSMCIHFIPNAPDTIQAALDVTSSNLSKDQLHPDLSGESSLEANRFLLWILLETLSQIDASNRANEWHNIEFLLAFVGCHAKTIHAVLLAVIGSHANTICQKHQHPSSSLYLDALRDYSESIKSHLQQKPPVAGVISDGRIILLPPHDQQAPNEIQKEIHDEVMAYLDQIQ